MPQMSSIYESVHERSAEYWNFAFVSSIVLEYAPARPSAKLAICRIMHAHACDL